jgi:hypothetical protein
MTKASLFFNQENNNKIITFLSIILVVIGVLLFRFLQNVFRKIALNIRKPCRTPAQEETQN